MNHSQDHKDNQNHVMDNATWEKEWFWRQGLQFDKFHFCLQTAEENKLKIPQEAVF